MATPNAKPHVIIIPYPAQGHINPTLPFAEFLAANGLRVSLVITTSLKNTAKIRDTESVAIHDISDGFELVKEPETIEVYLQRLKTNLSHNLAKFIDENPNPPRVVIYDSIMPWILDIAHERGLLGASFFTQACGVNAVHYHLKEGRVRFPYEEGVVVSLPAMPTLEMTDLPSFPVQAAFYILTNQFLNLERVDWIFFNTFDKLESEVLEWMKKQWPLKTIGPTCLLLKKKERLFNNKRHIINLFEPKHEGCKEWLDSKENNSVVYVSFGSLVTFTKEQMEELAYGLILSNSPFLWVVRSSEKEKLPHGFDSLALEEGLIVEWCHQQEVLAHPALACFLTHCGWNSTLEALINGVPLVAMPKLYDQPTNSKFVEDVWGIGVGVEVGENGIVGREEIAMRVTQVEGVEVKRNVCKWKELAEEAVEKGGTSANNVDEFISKLMNM